jgi:hypothetical protein
VVGGVEHKMRLEIIRDKVDEIPYGSSTKDIACIERQLAAGEQECVTRTRSLQELENDYQEHQKRLETIMDGVAGAQQIISGTERV